MQKALHILHLEDDIYDVELVQKALTQEGIPYDVQVVTTRDAYLTALSKGSFDVILSDSGVPGYSGLSACETAHERYPNIPFIFVSGSVSESDLARSGADLVSKAELERLGPAVRRALGRHPDER